MTISKTLEEAIQTKNLSRIYSSFYTIALSDPGFATGKFDDTLAYVRNLKIDGLMQPYDQKPFASKDAWNEDYWGKVASELMDNFCIERINHLKMVGQSIYASGQPRGAQAEQRQAYNLASGNQNSTQVHASEDKKKQNFYAESGKKNNFIPVLIAILAVLAILIVLIIVKLK